MGVEQLTKGKRIFLSYARDDNLTVESELGWVSYFHKAIENELLQWGIAESPLWRDKRDVQPFEQFSNDIENGLQSTAILISILSPAYLQRHWCMKELMRFSELIGLDSPEKRERIFKVIKRAVDDEPEPLRGQEGYRFFAIDPENNREVPYYISGRKPHDEYWDVINALSKDLFDQYQLLVGETVHERRSAAKPSKTVYLAYTSFDMSDDARRIRGELEMAGVRVLPDGNETPALDVSQMREKMQEFLIDAEFSVHPIGKSEGFSPEGAAEGIAVLQLNAAKNAGVKRVIWVPSRERDEGIKEVVRSLGVGEGMAPDDELVEEGFDRLKGLLRSMTTDQLQSKRHSSPSDLLAQIASMDVEQREALKKLLDLG